MADSRKRVLPRHALAYGIILIAVGAITPARPPEAPPWVGISAGLVFVLAGLALIVGYGIAGGVGADGDVPPGTPFRVRLVQYSLGIGIIAMMASIATWISFGPGTRQFSGGVSAASVSAGPRANRSA